MAMSKNLGMYADIHTVFENVLKHGGATLTFDTSAQRTTFRSRAYYYRTLLHEKQAAESLVDIANTSTPYDRIVIRDHPDERQVAQSQRRKLRIEENIMRAQIEFDSGADLETTDTTYRSSLEEEEEAARFAESFVEGLNREE